MSNFGYRVLGFGAGGDEGAQFDIIISADAFDWNLNTELTVLGWDGVSATTVAITVNTGITVGATNTTTAGMIISSLPAGSSITLTNNGNISGRGGTGGFGSIGGNPPADAGAGDPGGDAISLAHDITIDNTNGEIWGGGGGGGGGGGAGGVGFPDGGGGGGGGGAGTVGGTGRAGASVGGSSGNDGGREAGGGGGGSGFLHGSGASGGPGGAAGTVGGVGNNAFNSGGSGGSAGKAIDLNGNTATIIDSGDTRGAVS